MREGERDGLVYRTCFDPFRCGFEGYGSRLVFLFSLAYYFLLQHFSIVLTLVRLYIILRLLQLRFVFVFVFVFFSILVFVPAFGTTL